MSRPAPSISVAVDLTNPGQFFACCGLLELAHRLWPGAEGWFEAEKFHIICGGRLQTLLDAIVGSQLEQVDRENEMASPMRFPAPINLLLDWWTDEMAGGKKLKVWAGSMRGFRIARAMQHAIKDIAQPERLFDFAGVVYDPDQPKKKVEPFYFDSRRGRNAKPLDIGFSPDSLKMTTTAFPAVEFLCLVGIQRFRPTPTDKPRIFDYFTWTQPMLPTLVMATACGALRTPQSRSFRFENSFRTDQKKHKAFLPATPIGASS